MSGFWNQTQKLLVEDRFTGDKFGHDIDLHSNTIIGGVPEDNSSSGASTGALYIFEEVVLNVDEFTDQNAFVLYPNPTYGKLTVLMDRTFTTFYINVFNLWGQKVLSESFYETNLASFEINGNSGLYFIEISTSEEVITTFKVVKH